MKECEGNVKRKERKGKEEMKMEVKERRSLKRENTLATL